METASLLNIKSKAQQSTDIITGQALAMVSSDKNKTDGFKSAFKSQMDNKRNDDIRSEKKLPHNGNELPKKKKAVNEKDDNHKLKGSDDQLKNAERDSAENVKNAKKIDDDSVKNSQQTNSNKQADSHEQANSHEQADSHEQANSHEQADSREQANSHEHANADEQINVNEAPGTQEQENSSAAVKNSGQTLNDSIITEIIAAQQLEETVNSELSEQQTVLEQQSQQQSELNDKLSSVSSLNSEQLKSAISSESMHSDKKNQSEAFRGQFNINQPASSGNLISQMAADSASGTGSEGKNESALTKSIAEFQQFIEMSRKHSTAGESIASVKAFEQSMKTEQISAQLLLNNIKLPSAQLSAQPNQAAQVVIPSVSLDRVNSPLNSLSFSQTASSLEVKTPVGKAGWNQNFSNQIIMMANNGVQQAKIKLNPMSLGPVEAMVKLSGETAVVNLTSLHLSTKEALESALPRLKEMLNENGFSQVDVNVSHQDKKEQQEAALANKQDSNTGSNNEHGNSTMPGDEQLSEETLDSETGAQVSELDEQGLNIVDYYA